jgi:hypothetical protein
MWPLDDRHVFLSPFVAIKERGEQMSARQSTNENEAQLQVCFGS